MGLDMNIVYGYINTSGDTVIAMNNLYGGKFGNSMAPVIRLINEAAKAMFIDTAGVQVFGKTFTGVNDFADGIAPAATNGKWGFIDTTGEYVLEPKYSGYKFVYKYNNIAETFNPNNRSYTTKEGYFILKKNDKWGFIDKDEKIIMDFNYSDVSLPKNGLVEIKKVKKKVNGTVFNYQGLYDLNTNKLIIPAKYDQVKLALEFGKEERVWYEIGIDKNDKPYDGMELNGLINIKTGQVIEPIY